MTYAETLTYLFQQLPMYQRIGQAAYKADLESTHALMQVLDHPHRAFKTIHVAGTNGKGSVSHLLASVMQEAGLKTGLYTSPHLVDFRERIRVNGAVIPQDDIIRFVGQYQNPFETLQLSFFEWSVGLAFEHFRQAEVDIAIVEVGMGGRLDSTNVITPELSIITNIGMDHSQFLGDNLTQIAREKGGIIKPGVPVVVGQSHRETEGIFRKLALVQDATIAFADQQFPMDVPPCPLKGNYQKENFQTALISIDQLRQRGMEISDEHIKEGFANVVSNTGLRGRWETLRTHPKVICDVGHNREGIEHIADQLANTPHHDMHLVLGFVSDKEVIDLLKLFPENTSLYLCQPSIPRAMPIDRLAGTADQIGLKFKSFKSVPEAYQAALSAAHTDDLVFVGGSTFVVADLLAHLEA